MATAERTSHTICSDHTVVTLINWILRKLLQNRPDIPGKLSIFCEMYVTLVFWIQLFTNLKCTSPCDVYLKLNLIMYKNVRSIRNLLALMGSTRGRGVNRHIITNATWLIGIAVRMFNGSYWIWPFQWIIVSVWVCMFEGGNPTSPRILNKELFPQPLGPHTSTFFPDFTWQRKHR